MFTVEMLAAEYGDALWLEYGSGRNVHRTLIDGGTEYAAGALRRKIEALPVEQRRLELLVVTHIDADHLDGIYQVLMSPPKGLHIDQVWFNGYRHAEEAAGYLGALTAERFSRLLESQETKHPGWWNRAFDGNAVLARPDKDLPRFTLDSGLKLTVLGPSPDALARLGENWKEALEELDKKPGEVELPELVEDLELSGYLGALDVTALAKKKFTEDDAAPNGSSIVLLAEYDRHKVLLCGDAFPSDVAGAVQRLTGSERLKVSAIKAPHHGSRRNNSNALYSAISAEHFLISTNGARFKHPDLEGIARMLLNNKPEGRTTLHFNYRSPFNTVWDAAEIRNDWMYDTNYPSEGITVNL